MSCREYSGTQRKMAYIVTIRDNFFNTDTVAYACLLVKAHLFRNSRPWKPAEAASGIS